MWVRRQIQFVVAESICHLLMLYLSGLVETGVHMSLCMCV